MRRAIYDSSQLTDDGRLVSRTSRFEIVEEGVGVRVTAITVEGGQSVYLNRSQLRDMFSAVGVWLHKFPGCD